MPKRDRDSEGRRRSSSSRRRRRSPSPSDSESASDSSGGSRRRRRSRHSRRSRRRRDTPSSSSDASGSGSEDSGSDSGGGRGRRGRSGSRRRRDVTEEQIVEYMAKKAQKKAEKVAKKLKANAVSGYSNDSNPFGDPNLTEKRQLRKFVFKLRGKTSGIYVKDMYGTRKYPQNELIRLSSLSREIVQRIVMRQLRDEFDDLKSKGVLRWAVYRKERASINRLIASVRRSMDLYKSRRLELGLFYLTPRADVYDVDVHSHLLRMPLKEALRRRSQDVKRRREILASYYNNNNNSNKNSDDVQDTRASVVISNATTTTSTEHARRAMLGKACTKRLVLHTVASVVLGCAIMFF